MNTTISLLLVDDEPLISENLAAFLRRSGFQVTVATDGVAALRMVKEGSPDLLILDVEMPLLDGRAVLRQMRSEGNWTPIILLSKIGEADERSMALREGGDDYLNKPFSPQELVARIDALLRRTRQNQSSLTTTQRLVSGALTVDRQTQRLYLASKEINLPPKPFALLEYLMLNAGQLFTPEQLLDAVWGYNASDIYPQTVARHIAVIRRALGDQVDQPRYIETRNGGYAFLGSVKGSEKGNTR